MPDLTDKRPPRVIMCQGVNCNANHLAEALYAQLEALLDEADPFDPPFLLRTANCLDMFKDGPNLVIYPGNIRCNHLDEAELRRVIDAYVLRRPAADPDGVR